MGIYAEKWIEKNKNAKAAKDRVITEYNQDLKDSRTNPEYPDLMVAAISDMQVYNYIKKSFKARNLDDELKKLSGLNSKEVFARLKATHIFSKETLILIKKLNVDLEGSPHW